MSIHALRVLAPRTNYDDLYSYINNTFTTSYKELILIIFFLEEQTGDGTISEVPVRKRGCLHGIPQMENPFRQRRLACKMRDVQEAVRNSQGLWHAPS